MLIITNETLYGNKNNILQNKIKITYIYIYIYKVPWDFSNCANGWN